MGERTSTVRWPCDLYEQIRERAYEERQSINRTVVELVRKALERK